MAIEWPVNERKERMKNVVVHKEEKEEGKKQHFEMFPIATWF